jgi:putative transposase
MLAKGADIAEICRHLEVAEQSYHRWCAQYGGMKADDAKRLKELERENCNAPGLVDTVLVRSSYVRDRVFAVPTERG